VPPGRGDIIAPMRYGTGGGKRQESAGHSLSLILRSPHPRVLSLVEPVMAKIQSVALSELPKSGTARTVRISFAHPLTGAALSPGYCILSCTGQESRVIPTAGVLLVDAVELMHGTAQESTSKIAGIVR